MKFVTTIAYLLLTIWTASSQEEDINWIFGTGCGVTFQDISHPTTFKSTADNIELSASISDVSGNLEFFYSEAAFYNGNNDLIENGDSILTEETFARGMIIIPFTKESRIYHVFYVGGDVLKAELYHAVVDMTANQGGGLVVEKNVKIGQTLLGEGISAVKHGNGSYWWLLGHENGVDYTCTNKFVKYLIKNETITGPYFQEIGSSDCDGLYPGGSVKFSKSGNMLTYTDYVRNKILNVFNFDRCTGELSNFRVVDNIINPYGVEFSLNERYLYATHFSHNNNGSNALYQYDITSLDLVIPKVRIASLSNFICGMQIAPDNKIYITMNKWPNSSLSVINDPDSSLCDFRIFDFPLDTSCITFSGGLPNIPNYNLGSQRNCSVGIVGIKEEMIKIYPNPATETLTVEGLKRGSIFQLVDLAGREVLTEKLTLEQSRIDIKNLSNGIYIYKINRDSKTGKIVIAK